MEITALSAITSSCSKESEEDFLKVGTG